ncbi:hypothetical protein PENTCL1PPCAC_12403, partial [Pristionchus entomophagus]
FSVALSSKAAPPPLSMCLLLRFDEAYQEEEYDSEEELLRMGCNDLFCRNENKNGCRGKCDEYAKKCDINVIWEEVTYKTIINQQDCINQCKFLAHNDGSTTEVCSFLCGALFTDPKWALWATYGNDVPQAFRDSYSGTGGKKPSGRMVDRAGLNSQKNKEHFIALKKKITK